MAARNRAFSAAGKGKEDRQKGMEVLSTFYHNQRNAANRKRKKLADISKGTQLKA